MRTHRGKQFDWSKPFKLIDSKQTFDEIQVNQNQFIININAKTQQASAPIQKKQQIIVPKIQTVPRITEVKKFATVDPNYHRLAAHLSLPKLINYQLNEVDHMFLQGHAHRFIFKNKPILNQQFLSKTFVEMEIKAGKDPVLPKNKSWMMSYLQKQNPQLLTYENLQQFAELLYNYWKNRRQELKFPLLRSLWRPNPDEFNHLLAFKPRQKEKRNLRRNNRLPEDDIAQELEEEFCLSLKIAQRIKSREEAKFRQVHFQIFNFQQDYKNIFGSPDFLPEFNFQNRTKDKEKLKKLANEVDLVKKNQIEIEKENQELQIMGQVFDNKQSITEFLSTVIQHAEAFGLSHEKIFTQKNIKANDESKQKQKQKQKQEEEKPEEIVAKNEGTQSNIILMRKDDTIYRLLDEDTEQQSYMKSPKNYLEYKKMQVKSYYYGDDDEGDYKDLKRNISQSYKKFLSQFHRNSINE